MRCCARRAQEVGSVYLPIIAVGVVAGVGRAQGRSATIHQAYEIAENRRKAGKIVGSSSGGALPPFPTHRTYDIFFNLPHEATDSGLGPL